MGSGLRSQTPHRKLLLVGGCDLVQLSNFCQSHNVEFVNFMNIRPGPTNFSSFDGTGVRYDDPSFFTADRRALRDNESIKKLSGWTYDNTVLLDQIIPQADVIILAMRAVLRHHYAVTKENIYIRIRPENLKLYLDRERDWFKRHFAVAELSTGDRLGLIATAFEVLKAKSREDSIIFVLGDNARTEFNIPEFSASIAYNNFCRKFCEDNAGKFNFVDIRSVVQEGSLIDAEPKTALNSNVRMFASSVRLAALLRAHCGPTSSMPKY
jgi:hypothetical protein